MENKEIIDQLENIASKQDFAASSAELVALWASSGAGIEILDPILQFMEEHPSIDYGAPGALVHFAERYFDKGYEEKLMNSIRRKPMRLTIWMLNRVINGTKAPDIKRHFIAAMEEAKLNQFTDSITLQQINRFLERITI
jgi:hypothetical protein